MTGRNVASQVSAKKSGLPEPVTDVATGLENFGQYGFNHHRGYLDEATVSRLKDRVLEQAEMERELGVANIGGPKGAIDLVESVPGDKGSYCYQLVEFLPNKGRVFIDLFMHPLGLAYAKGVFGEHPSRLWASAATITQRGLARQNPHYDEGILPLDMCTRPTLLNIFICLTDFEEEMGATQIYPGTHRHIGEITRDNIDEWPCFTAVAKAGDALMWDGRTWHGGGQHRSDKTRIAIGSGYNLLAVTSQHQYPTCLSDEVYETLSDEELKVLGFEAVEFGFTNRIIPRNASDRRSNVGRSTPFVPELHRDF
jgi:hypothetical protein